MFPPPSVLAQGILSFASDRASTAQQESAACQAIKILNKGVWRRRVTCTERRYGLVTVVRVLASFLMPYATALHLRFSKKVDCRTAIQTSYPTIRSLAQPERKECELATCPKTQINPTHQEIHIRPLASFYLWKHELYAEYPTRVYPYCGF